MTAEPRGEILIATSNSGKIREFQDLIADLNVETVPLTSFPTVEEVQETGSTFSENARLKAAGYALQTGLYALADDSGLEVAALGARPGVLSARYGGPDKTFPERISLLLAEMAASGTGRRDARFVCSMAIAAPNGGIVYETMGICTGTIARTAAGEGGFGYDPIFIPTGYSETFGQLESEIKRSISHRARAFEQIIPFLRDNIAI